MDTKPLRRKQRMGRGGWRCRCDKPFNWPPVHPHCVCPQYFANAMHSATCRVSDLYTHTHIYRRPSSACTAVQLWQPSINEVWGGHCQRPLIHHPVFAH